MDSTELAEEHDAASVDGMESAALPFVSVIVPHLNQPDALRRCLQSLANQSYPRDGFEVIVVDNGSAVSPTGIIASFPGARLEHEAEPGPGPARNRGVAAAQGEILAFVDADCRADPGWLDSIASRYAEAPDKLILGGDVRIDILDPERMTMLEAYETVFAYRQRMYIEKHGFSGTGNLAVRRSDFDAVGPFAGIRVAEDRDWGRRAIAKGLRTAYVPEMIVYHPARRSFAEIYAKWDRQIVHDWEDWRAKRRPKLLWLLRAAAIALSPLAEGPRILSSRLLTGLQQRGHAILALVLVRSHRFRQMVSIAITSNGGTPTPDWNR